MSTATGANAKHQAKLRADSLVLSTSKTGPRRVFSEAKYKANVKRDLERAYLEHTSQKRAFNEALMNLADNVERDYRTQKQIVQQLRSKARNAAVRTHNSIKDKHKFTNRQAADYIKNSSGGIHHSHNVPLKYFKKDNSLVARFSESRDTNALEKYIYNEQYHEFLDQFK